MKFLFTYDSHELEHIKKIADFGGDEVKKHHVFTLDKNSEERNLYDVAKDIKAETSGDESCIIFINQYLACKDEGFEWLQRSAGIALIKFLRMMHVKDRIVLVTPHGDDPLQLIRDDPANLIISSKGISCTKYLHTFLEEKSLDKLKNLSTKQFDKDLKPYLKVDFELPQNERHNWANWWGIDRLLQIHFIIENKGIIETLDRKELENYPDALSNTIKQIKNFQILFLFGQIDNLIYLNLLRAKKEFLQIEEELRGLAIDLQSHHQLEQNYRKKIADLKEIVHDLRKQYPFLDSRSFENEDKIYEQLESLLTFQNISTYKSRKKNVRNELLDFIDEDVEKKQLRSELEDQLNQLEFEVQELKKIISESHIFEIIDKRNELRENPPRILYIDDQAKEGWSEIFQHMIYGELKESNDDTFTVLPKPDTKIQDIDEFFEEVRSEKKRINPDVVLLDLRLKGELGTQINVKELSGAVILKQLRSIDPSIPIIMTTASNKFWSYEGLQQLNQHGHFGFWAKEGIDVILDEKESAQNYTKLLDLISSALDS